MKLRCGTRGSALALTQTQLVIDALQQIFPQSDISRHEIKTLGDKKQGTVAASVSDKKDWVYELELALLHNKIDFAVHSGKDIPYEIEPGTALLPVLVRGNPLDAFIGRMDPETGQRSLFEDLPIAATVGTASLRRKACLLQLRPDLNVVEHRGNVQTRLRKLDESDELAGIVLASAGLERLQIEDLSYETIAVVDMIPALNQGTLVAQFRADDSETKNALQALVDDTTLATWQAERRVAEILQGDCKSAISIYAVREDDELFLIASVMLSDGSESVDAGDSARVEQAGELGERVGQRLLALGAEEIIEKSQNI